MTRSAVHVRDAVAEDADVLVDLWREMGADHTKTSEPTSAGAQRAVGVLALDPDQRLVLAEVDGHVVGCAHLMRSPSSPIHEEQVVRLGHLFVRAGHRRRGAGRALLGEAAAWADEKQSTHLLITVSASARDANRFLARLGFGSVATVRGARVSALKERLAKFEAADDGRMMVERIRTLRRRKASARPGVECSVD